jgi:hypothetical protein
MPDRQLLLRATALHRILVTQDEDFLGAAAQLQHQHLPFAGIVHYHPLLCSIGQTVNDLVLIASVATADDLADQLLYLPL